MGLFRNLAGEVRLCVTGADLEGTLRAANGAGILISDAALIDDFTMEFTIARRDFRRFHAIARRRGDTVHLDRRQGMYWNLKGLLKRPVFLAGVVMFLVLALFVPSRVYIVEVQGSGNIPANLILETAAECGISFGASRRAVRSERVKNALLEAMPELAWAGVNTYGCRAVITVRARDPEPAEGEIPAVTSIIAARDGFILSCDVASGNGLCSPGQAVKAGEVLISGYTDCGICITATRAEGEVMALTSREVTALTPANCLKKDAETGAAVQYSLIVGKNRINFNNNSGISDAVCGRMVTEYHLTLPGGYRLPVTLVKEIVTELSLSEAETDRDTAEALLKVFARRYLGTQMIAGTITDAVESVTARDNVWRLAGDYACTEMIGRERAERNGEYHETD